MTMSGALVLPLLPGAPERGSGARPAALITRHHVTFDPYSFITRPT